MGIELNEPLRTFLQYHTLTYEVWDVQAPDNIFTSKDEGDVEEGRYESSIL